MSAAVLRGLIAALVLPTAAAAQNNNMSCGSHAAAIEALAARWGESRQAIALERRNGVVEVWASLETGTWTILVTAPGGPTCVVASGHAFELTAEPPPAPGVPG